MPARGSAGRSSTARSSRIAPDALWSRALLERCRVASAPPLQRIVVAVDPPASSGKRADACGIVAAGIAEDGIVYVLADDTVARLTPAAWAREGDRAVAAAARPTRWWSRSTRAARWCARVIDEVDAAVPVTPVRATRGKWLRAEPVAALYEQGRVKHAGSFAALEDEMCDFGPNGSVVRPLAGPARRAGLGGDALTLRPAQRPADAASCNRAPAWTCLIACDQGELHVRSH